jgi:hypothetical protein
MVGIYEGKTTLTRFGNQLCNSINTLQNYSTIRCRFLIKDKNSAVIFFLGLANIGLEKL